MFRPIYRKIVMRIGGAASRDLEQRTAHLCNRLRADIGLPPRVDEPQDEIHLPLKPKPYRQ